MAAWITIYAELDWWTLGESVGMEEDAVNALMASLTWAKDAVGQKGKRPLQLHVWTAAKRVKTELAELENMPASVVPRLAGVRTVIAIDYGISQIDMMLEVVAFELALIEANDDRWFDHDAHRWDAFA